MVANEPQQAAHVAAPAPADGHVTLVNEEIDATAYRLLAQREESEPEAR